LAVVDEQSEEIDCVFIWEIAQILNEKKQSSLTVCCGMHIVLFNDTVLNI
jgi:hypothetical protein